MNASILAQQMGFNPSTVIVCNGIGCENAVKIGDSFAFPACRARYAVHIQPQ
jgi:hypothetical protein